MKKKLLLSLGIIFILSGCGQVEKDVKIPHPANVRAYEPKQEEIEEAELIKQSIKNYQERHEIEAEKALYGAEKPSIEQILFSENLEFDTMVQDDVELEIYFDSLEELAVCVMAEAGNQGVDGMRMVCDVILNRVNDSGFPNTIHGVISQPYQFSSYWDGGIKKVIEPSKECYDAVRMELGNVGYPGILYFQSGCYSEYGTPAFKHGEHYFSIK